ncbi:MAG: VOC family protein [Pseudomonadota bacterium]
MTLRVVTLGIDADPSAAVVFYQNVLDVQRVETKGDVTYLHTQTITLALFSAEGLRDYLGVEEAGGWGRNCLSVNVADVNELNERFRAAVESGATTLRSPAEAAWGGHIATFCDPYGHVWELVWNPRPFLD